MSTNGRLTTSDLIGLIEQKTGRAGKRVSRETVLICPFHEGPQSTPSLNVREGDGGYPLIRCRSRGCTPEEVLGSLGLTWLDVFGDDSEHWTPSGPWVALYDYTDADGTLLYQVCRTADKKFSQRQPDPDKPHGYKWNLEGVKRVPYRLPQVLAAIEAKKPIYIVEGEKDVRKLEREGHVATCNSGGAGKWPKEFARFFTNATVVIVADRDTPGYRHALTIQESLAQVAKTVTLTLPKSGKDAADHLEAGHGVDALVPVDPIQLEQSLRDSGAATGEGDEGPDEGVPVLRFLSGREFIAQPLAKIDPLFGVKGDGLMMPGSLVLLAGIGGAGKTTLSLHMLAHFAAGLPWFGIQVARPIRTVVIENEGPHDPYVEKVKEFAERFKGCTCSGEPHGSDVFLDNCRFQDAPWGKFTFEDTGLAAELRAQVIDFQGDLVVANPLGRLGMKGAGTPEETRAFLQLLANAGLGEDFAALLLHHLAKVSPGTPLVQQVSGDWGPHPDTIMVMETAGERRSKLSFGKVRWGDQGRTPMILDWNVDPNGPIGYQSNEPVKGVSDSELWERIDGFLREQEKPSGITQITKGVVGQSVRVKALVERGVGLGRYGSSGAKRSKFWLLDPDAPTQEEMEV